MLERRASGPEYMDGPEFGLNEVLSTFRMLVPVNRLFGGIRPGLAYFRRESRHWDRQTTYRILDVGCGVGDMATALARWGRQAGYRLRIEGIDHHPIVVDLARQRCRDYPEISITCQDVWGLDEDMYDYVHASQFVHHFRDDGVAPLLNHLLAHCRRALVVNDLLRTPLAYGSTWVFTLFSNPVFRHDARLSVRRGFKMDELAGLLRAGGLDQFSLKWQFWYRCLLIINKPQVIIHS